MSQIMPCFVIYLTKLAVGVGPVRNSAIIKYRKYSLGGPPTAPAKASSWPPRSAWQTGWLGDAGGRLSFIKIWLQKVSF
ncbi:MAG: hypothetical protein A2174_01235 [Candidatus Portnoybacteria bacterium RBG_13_41_18]|uniref:Uncharacterized protein n=1 Tax=Candidatus Portnoybacteria bacterium RBG_13_41_18 TaxID=1801991 RepID=A0A1G2F684_9BACT|nr:MAG: hypothetical protein A2174_01235 [Candidatus Portnoybacteria bacterium RBG_13_41_18]